VSSHIWIGGRTRHGAVGRVCRGCCALLVVLALGHDTASGQERRKIIIDQDEAGPAGTDLQSTLLLIQSPQTDVLGITVVTGDMWLKEEVAHTLRMLELIERTDIPVVPGAENPLVREKLATELWEERYGKVRWLGAWTPLVYHPAEQIPEMKEGSPKIKPLSEDAAHFLVRMVRQFPNQVTIYEGGPMTNLALAITIDPEFPSLVKELVFMGASFSPVTDDPEFVNTPRREFNLWFDPEAAHIVLRAKWKKIVCTPVDISVKTRMSPELLDGIRRGTSPAARYIGQYTVLRKYNYLWDELAAVAWLDPSIVTKSETRFVDVNLDRGGNWGDVLSWSAEDKPSRYDVQPLAIQVDLDLSRFYKLLLDLLNAPTPRAVPH
jgi:inosine-uridine nucleoside N-ribohydrolase